MQALIRNLEEYSFRALPALTTRYYHGWLFRFANGYTRRANSVNPLYGFSDDIDYQITLAEDAYKRADLQPIFKLTDASQPGDLDDRLAHRGYEHSETDAIMTHTLDDTVPAMDPAVHFQTQFDPNWRDPFFRLSEIATDYQKTVGKLFDKSSNATGYALLCEDDQAVACGRVVIDGEWAGLYSIVTATEFRRRGYGTRITEALMAWAREQGATNVYLQVHSQNDGALTLYDKLGFKTAYQYWYRQAVD